MNSVFKVFFFLKSKYNPSNFQVFVYFIPLHTHKHEHPNPSLFLFFSLNGLNTTLYLRLFDEIWNHHVWTRNSKHMVKLSFFGWLISASVPVSAQNKIYKEKTHLCVSLCILSLLVEWSQKGNHYKWGWFGPVSQEQRWPLVQRTNNWSLIQTSRKTAAARCVST